MPKKVKKIVKKINDAVKEKQEREDSEVNSVHQDKDTLKSEVDSNINAMEYFNNLTESQRQALIKEIEKKKIRNSYVRYLKYVYPDFIITKFHALLANICQSIVEKVENGEKVRVLISVPFRHGKGYPVDYPILTPQGWKAHGDLQVGDYVYNDKGEQVKVLGTQEHYMHPCMKVTFSTGEEHIVTREHLWKVSIPYETRRSNGVKRVHGRERRTKVLETQEIAKLLGRYGRNPSVFINEPLQNEDKNLPINPYILGLWLGDGISLDNQIVVSDKDLQGELAQIEGVENYKLVKRKYNPTITYIQLGNKIEKVGRNGFTNDFRKKLKEMNLLGNKHIPMDYLLASEWQRWELLRGLMDTDGSVNKNADCEYTAINKELAENVWTLLRSLGIKATINEYDATLKGRFISKKYRVVFRGEKGKRFFYLDRKQERIDNKVSKDRVDKKQYFITKIEEVDDQLVSCINVEGGMYLAGKGLIPTHNSMTITKTLPSWFVGRNPTKWAILTAYNADLAEEFSNNNRQLIKNFGREIFGIETNDSQDNKYLFQMHKVGEKENPNTDSGIMGVGIQGGIVGHGGQLIIVDDPYKNDLQAENATERENISRIFKSAVLTRTMGKGNAVIVIHTRWHDDDLIGELEKTGDWLVINIPLVWEKGIDKLLGRKIGQTLCPELGFDSEWAEMTRKAIGNRLFQANCQGKPYIEGGNIVKRSDIKWYDKKTKPSVFEELTLSCDLSFGGMKKENDPYCMTLWGRIGADHYLLNVWGKRASFSETQKTIRTIKAQYPMLKRIIIERKAMGMPIMEVLGKEIGGIVPYDPKGTSKESRFNSVSPYFEGGNIYFPTEDIVSDIEEYVEQVLRFPNVGHDDFVDTISQYLLNYEYKYGGKIQTDSIYKSLSKAIRGLKV